MNIVKVFLIFTFMLFISCSKDQIKKSIIQEKDLELQVLEAYKEGMESLKQGDVLFAANRTSPCFKESIPSLYASRTCNSKSFS